jgi:hypothetical protein
MGISTGLEQRHARNTGITESKRKEVSKASSHVQGWEKKNAYVVPKSKRISY